MLMMGPGDADDADCIVDDRWYICDFVNVSYGIHRELVY